VKTKAVTLDPIDAWFFSIMTVRYALPRMSTAGGTAQELVLRYSSLLSVGQLRQIAEEVESHIENEERTKSVSESTQMWLRVDRPGWVQFAEGLRKKIEDRGDSA
jgi:hypothetical protein